MRCALESITRGAKPWSHLSECDMCAYDVTIETHFCAAHALRHYKGATEPTHGHNFKLSVTVTSREVDRSGMAIDFLDLKAMVEKEVGRLGYRNLNNDVPEFGNEALSPSAENIARVLHQRLKPQLPAHCCLSRVTLQEAPGCTVTYREA